MSYKPYKSRPKSKRKARRKCHSNGTRREGGGTARPQVMVSRDHLRRFTLDMRPEEIIGSHETLIKDIQAMLAEDVRLEMQKLPKKERKPETLHGKPYTPKDGAFLVELVHPGKETVTLLFGKNNMYLNGLHVSELWFLLEGCEVPIPPSSQLRYGFKSVPSENKKKGVFNFPDGVYLFNWSGSYLDLRGDMKQPFFHGAPEKAHSLLSKAESLVVEDLDAELQRAVAFFIIFIPECIRFPYVRRWARSRIAPGSVMGIVPTHEHRGLMRSWGTRSDDMYCVNTPVEIRMSVDIIKRNPLKHSLLKLKTKYEKPPSSSVPCNKAVKAKDVGADEVVLNELHAFNEDYVANQEVVAEEVVVNDDHAFNDEDAVHQEDELHVEEVVEDDALNEEDELDVAEVVGDDALSEDDPLSEEGEVGVVVYQFTGHTEEVKSVACHPEDSLVVLSGGTDEKAYLWKIASDNPEDVHELSGHTDTVSSVAFNSDGSLLACASVDGTISVWTTDTGALLTCLQGPEKGKSFEWVKWHPRRKAILAGSDDHMMWFWHLDRKPGNYLLHVFAGHTQTVTCGDFMPDGNYICSGSDDASLRVWCVRTACQMCTIEGADFHSRGLTCLAVTKDSKFIYTCSRDGSVRVVSIEPGDVAGALKGQVVGALKGQVVGALKGHDSTVCCIGISAEGVVATGSRDSKLIIWDAGTREARHSLHHEGIVTCLAWLRDTRFVATGCSDGCITIWDSESGLRRATLDSHDDRVLAIAVSCDCVSVVSVGADTQAVSHNIASLQLV